ncbi:MAG: hypothetical protein IJX02_07840, partial [Clostridia bacterium]|nr:hypothetical protein [Clostridia bacterium]
IGATAHFRSFVKSFLKFFHFFAKNKTGLISKLGLFLILMILPEGVLFLWEIWEERFLLNCGFLYAIIKLNLRLGGKYEH